VRPAVRVLGPNFLVIVALTVSQALLLQAPLQVCVPGTSQGDPGQLQVALCLSRNQLCCSAAHGKGEHVGSHVYGAAVLTVPLRKQRCLSWSCRRTRTRSGLGLPAFCDRLSRLPRNPLCAWAHQVLLAHPGWSSSDFDAPGVLFRSANRSTRRWPALPDELHVAGRPALQHAGPAARVEGCPAAAVQKGAPRPVLGRPDGAPGKRALLQAPAGARYRPHGLRTRSLPCDLLKHTGCRPLACKLYARFQEYLDAAKQGGEVGRTAGVPYNFEFYVQDGEARAGAPQRLLARPRSLLPSSAPSAVDA